jgi:hypothetical protein
VIEMDLDTREGENAERNKVKVDISGQVNNSTLNFTRNVYTHNKSHSKNTVFKRR